MTNSKLKIQEPKSDYQSFHTAEMAEIKQNMAAYLTNPLPWGMLPDIEFLPLLEEEGDMQIENGYTVADDGSIAIALKTSMPATTPQMWDWWFGWHGCEDGRYALWHPKAHISAKWEDEKNDDCYIGRNSIIKEYIGNEILEAAIQFKSPLEFGFSYKAANAIEEAVYICAKLGHPKLPIDYGYLVHQVRTTSTGTEMRSRFWIGGKYITARHDHIINNAAVAVLKKMKSLPGNFGHDLMLHCAEEMNHLASILPAIYKEYGCKENEDRRA